MRQIGEKLEKNMYENPVHHRENILHLLEASGRRKVAVKRLNIRMTDCVNFEKHSVQQMYYIPL